MKLTTSQVWLIHSLELLALGGIFTTVATVYGAFQVGNFNLGSAGVAVGSAVVALLSKGFSGIIANTNTAQAVGDTVSELKQSHNVLIAQVSNLAGLMTNLFHIHIAQQASLASTSQSVQNAPQALQSSPWGSQAPQVPQQQFPPLPQYTAPTAAISSSQAQQARQPGQ